MSELLKPIKTIEIQGEPEIHGGGELELKIWKQGVTIIKNTLFQSLLEKETHFSPGLSGIEWQRQSRHSIQDNARS